MQPPAYLLSTLCHNNQAMFNRIISYSLQVVSVSLMIISIFVIVKVREKTGQRIGRQRSLQSSNSFQKSQRRMAFRFAFVAIIFTVRTLYLNIVLYKRTDRKGNLLAH